MLSVSIGVCVYNEEKNIGKLLVSLSNQKTGSISIKEIIVISSACTDKTDEIVREFAKKDERVKLVTQEKRKGKSSAINLFLKKSNSDVDILVLESGDTLPLEDTIENLVKAFLDPKVGMTGGHPIPVNDQNTLTGFAVHLLWNLHHKLALNTPKLGELVAFRNVVEEIPDDTAVDEACIEAIIMKKGYELRYVPDAILYNKGPETISDFLKQRRRIYAGHLHLSKTMGYAPSSMGSFHVLRLLFEDINFNPFNPKKIIQVLFAMFLEFLGRFLGMYDFYVKKKNPYIWDIAKTTKEIQNESGI